MPLIEVASEWSIYFRMLPEMRAPIALDQTVAPQDRISIFLFQLRSTNLSQVPFERHSGMELRECDVHTVLVSCEPCGPHLFLWPAAHVA